MGYDLHISRAEYWRDNEGQWIPADDWIAYVEADPELELAGYNGPYHALWDGGSQSAKAWFDWREGNIYTKNPDPAIITKLELIAEYFAASVQGDEGERYRAGEQLFELDDSVIPKATWWRRLFAR